IVFIGSGNPAWVGLLVKTVSPSSRWVVRIYSFRIGTQAAIVIRIPGRICFGEKQPAAIVVEMLVGPISHPMRKDFAKRVVFKMLVGAVRKIFIRDPVVGVSVISRSLVILVRSALEIIRRRLTIIRPIRLLDR